MRAGALQGGARDLRRGSQRAVQRQPRAQAVARGGERGLHQDLAGRPGVAVLLRLGAREAVHQRGQAGRRPQRRLAVHRAHLDRAQARVRADVPPEEGVVGQVAGVDHALHGLGVVVVGRKRARDLGARVAAEELRARRREARVAAVPEGRVGGQGLQQRELLAQPVEHADGRRGIGHPDVHVQGARRRAADEALQLGDDAVIARLVDVLDVPECAVGMDAGADRRAPRGADAGPQRAERRRTLAGVAHHGRGELHEGRVGVGVREAIEADLVHARQHVDARVRQRPRALVDEQQLLLHAEGEVRLLAEPRPADGVGQLRPRAWRARHERPEPWTITNSAKLSSTIAPVTVETVRRSPSSTPDRVRVAWGLESG